MNVTKAKTLLYDTAKAFPEVSNAVDLEKAAMAFAKAKQRNANNRDKWKTRKRLTVSGGKNVSP